MGICDRARLAAMVAGSLYSKIQSEPKTKVGQEVGQGF